MQGSFFRRGSCIVKSILFPLLFLSANHAGAQDLRFTQVHASETWLNPAFAGSYRDARLILNFRDQWPNMPQTYISYRAGFEDYIEKMRSGFGVSVFQDNQGDQTLKTTMVGLQYMYQAKFSDVLALNFGLELNYVQTRINWSNLQFYDQINMLYGFNDVFGNPNPTGEIVPGSLSDTHVDVGAGALLVGNSFYAGFSAHHLTTPTVSFYGNSASKVPVALSGQVGYRITGKANKNPLIFNPLAVYTNHGGFQQIETGAYLKKNILLTGIFFRHNTENLSDISLCAGISKGLFSFAYSYDISTGELAGITGGAHEVSMIFKFEEKASKTLKKNQKNMLDCPRVL